MRAPSTAFLGVSAVAFLALVLAQGTKNDDFGIPWQYQGLAVWAFGWGALDAFGIGANDVANAFANAVAAKTLSYGQAVMMAAIAEFIGAVALGNNVTDTIRGKIVDVKRFTNDPYMLMLGMSTTSIGSSLWIMAATFLGMPVSTTHSTVGAVMGIGIAAFGTSGVNWSFEGGFVGIVASWFISPVASGVIAAAIYMTVKLFVLSQPEEVAFKRALISLPIYAFVTFGIVTGFLIWKGIPLLKSFSKKLDQAVPTVIGVGVFFAVFTALTVVPWLRRFIADNENLPWYTFINILCVPVGSYGYYEEGTHDDKPAAKKARDGEQAAAGGNAALSQMAQAPAQAQASAQMPAGGAVPMGQPYMYPQQRYPYGQPGVPGFGMPYSQQVMSPMGYGGPQVMGQGFGQNVQVMGAGFGGSDPDKPSADDRPRVLGVPMFYTTDDKWYDTIFRKISPGLYIDIDALTDECAELHSHAVVHDGKTERMYKALQVSTSFFFSLAHGANDIANAMGPLSAVWAIYSTGTLNSKSPVEAWILAYGALWMDIGLLTMGHNIMMVLGQKLTYQTPSRGFCMDLSAMFTVLVASNIGVPVSTTHCITGATIGVGLCNGDFRAINWRMMVIIFGGWVITVPCAGLFAGIVFWGLATTPHATPGNGFFQ